MRDERDERAAAGAVEQPRVPERDGKDRYQDRNGIFHERQEVEIVTEDGEKYQLPFLESERLPKVKTTHVATETKVEDGQALAAIFTSIGLVPSFQYEKFRTEWSDGSGHVVLDETPIGNIAEIEGPPEWIDATAAKLKQDEAAC